MRPEFYDIYEDLFYDYLGNYQYYRKREFPRRPENDFIKLIRREIERSDNKNNLRPDAKYFLLVNFHHLVVEPVLQSIYSNGNEKINFERLEAAIRGDIRTIVSKSITKIPRGEGNDNLVSGHEIISTIDVSWNNLDTMQFEIWG